MLGVHQSGSTYIWKVDGSTQAATGQEMFFTFAGGSGSHIISLQRKLSDNTLCTIRTKTVTALTCGTNQPSVTAWQLSTSKWRKGHIKYGSIISFLILEM